MQTATLWTMDDVRHELRRLAERAGSQRALARTLGVHETRLSEALRPGSNRMPESILRALGLEERRMFAFVTAVK